MSRAMEIKGRNLKEISPLCRTGAHLERCSRGGCVKEIAGGFARLICVEMGGGGMSALGDGEKWTAGLSA